MAIDVPILIVGDEIDNSDLVMGEAECGECKCECLVEYDPDTGGLKGVCEQCGAIYHLTPYSWTVESVDKKED